MLFAIHIVLHKVQRQSNFLTVNFDPKNHFVILSLGHYMDKENSHLIYNWDECRTFKQPCSWFYFVLIFLTALLLFYFVWFFNEYEKSTVVAPTKSTVAIDCMCCQWQYGTIKYLSSSSLFSSKMVDRHSSPGQSSPSFYPILRSLKVKVAPLLWSKSQRSEVQTLCYLCSFAVLHVTNTSSMRQHGFLHYGDEGGGKLYQITCVD